MAKKRFLTNAPIREALIDIRIAPSVPCEMSALQAVADQVDAEYPNRAELVTGTVNVEMRTKDALPTFDRATNGLRLTSADGTRAVQFRKDGFTFNRLRPYSTWDEMRTEAKRLWDIYQPTSNAIEVSRVATRFINDLGLPMPVEDLARYVVTPPRVPDSLPQSTLSFFSRMVVESEKPHAQCVITLALEGVTDETAPVFFDIDVFRAESFSPGADEYWELLDQFRTLKNDIFFESLTETCVRLYE